MTSNPPPIQFSDFARVMGQIGQQSLDSTGRYADEEKVYVKLGPDQHLVAVQGKQGRAEKNLRSEQLIEIAQNSFPEVTSSTSIS